MRGPMRTLLWKEWRDLGGGYHGLHLHWRWGVLSWSVGAAVFALVFIVGAIMPGEISVGGIAVLAAILGLGVGAEGPVARTPYELLFTQPVARRTVLAAKLIAAGAVVLSFILLAAAIRAVEPRYWLERWFFPLGMPSHAPASVVFAAAAGVAALGVAAGAYAGVRFPMRPRSFPGWRFGLHAGLPVVVGFFLASASGSDEVRARLGMEPTPLQRQLAEVERTWLDVVQLYEKKFPGEPLPPDLKEEAKEVEASLRVERAAALDRTLLAACLLLACGSAAALYVRAAMRAIGEREVPET